MAEDGTLSPSRFENLRSYLDGIREEDISYLVKNNETFQRMCEALVRAAEPLERRETAFERLFQVVQRLALRAEDLQQLIDTWLPKRQALVETIRNESSLLNVMTKACNSSRLASSVIDTVGLIGGLFIGESNDQHANLMFSAGKICRVVGFSASALEVFKKKSVLENLMKLMKEDQTSFAPIEAFFLQDNELEEAIRQLLPLKVTSRLIEDFLTRSIDDELSQLEMLQLILRPLLLEDTRRLKDVVLIRNLIAFTSCPAAKDWCRWIIIRHHRVSLDIDTVLLQMVAPQRFIGNQSVGLTAIDDRPSNISIISRIGLNCVTIYDAMNSLKNSGMVESLNNLHDHLRLEMNTVVQISRLLHIRS